MQIYCRGTAKILHAETGETYEIDSEELEWDTADICERQMGPEAHYEATIEHTELGQITWGLWEYPLGIENYQNTNSGEHEVLENFDYGLEHEEPEPDDWLSHDPPHNPHKIFINSHHHISALLAQHGGAHGNFLLNRMVFSHQITNLEAYLGDTLINEVMSDTAAFQRLITEADDLKDAKFTLSEIERHPDLIQSTVRTHLRTILYHNLAKVDVLYDIAFKFRILSLAKDKSKLFRAVSLRHDCVHRNGYDKDGNELTVFTKQFVQETADLIRELVDGIEQAVRSR